MYVLAPSDVFVVGYVATKTFTSSLLRANDRWIETYICDFIHQRDVLYQDCEVPHRFLLWPRCCSSYTRNGFRFTRLRFDHSTPAQSTLAVLNFLRSFPVTFYVKDLDVQTALQIVSYIFSKIIWCKCFKFTASSSFLKRHQDPVLSNLHASYQYSANFPPFFYTSIATNILVFFNT